jgi:hypothetical protein
MSVIVTSLAKLSGHGPAWNNLWTVDDDPGEERQRDAMDHCVRIMALFGTRWLAHAYGPVGTIGQERSFLGSPPLPGYPHHSTWKEFPRWNQYLALQETVTAGRLPEANLLVVYPVETLYAHAGPGADTIARRTFELLLALLDRHYHVDVLSAAEVEKGRWRHSQFECPVGRHDLVLLPSPEVVTSKMKQALGTTTDRVLCVFSGPEWTEHGKVVAGSGWKICPSTEAVLDQLAQFPELRPVTAPAGTWITRTAHDEGMIVTLAPARCYTRYAGTVGWGGARLNVSESTGLTRILFSRTGVPRILKGQSA